MVVVVVSKSSYYLVSEYVSPFHHVQHTYDVAAILTSIQSLLHDPNPNSPANAEAANLYRENRKEYVRRVRETVESSWE